MKLRMMLKYSTLPTYDRLAISRAPDSLGTSNSSSVLFMYSRITVFPASSLLVRPEESSKPTTVRNISL